MGARERERLEYLESVVRAIREGAVDGVVVGPASAETLYTLSGADRVYRRLVERLADGVVTGASDGTLLYANDAFATMVGVSLERLIGSSLRELLVADGYSAIEPMLAAGGREGRVEVVLRGPNEREVPVLASAAPIDDGDVPMTCLAFSDLTALKAQAAELERSNAELEQFAYVASHDLSEPLRTIGGFVQLLERRYAGKLGEDADRFIAHTVEGVARMQALIDDLLALSRVGSRELELSDISASQALEDTVRSLGPLLQERGAEIAGTDLPTVSADATMLGQLFQNLIVNGVTYNESLSPRVEVSAERGKGGWTFAFADNGIGIPPAQVQRVFKTFQRLHGRDDYRAGTGVGLAICERIVERHGGRIWFEPREGGGTVFRFTIPGGAEAGASVQGRRP